MHDESVASVVRDAWEATLGSAKPADEDDFFEAGGDSISAMSLMETVEAQLGIEFPTDTLFREGTCGALIDACANRVAALKAT
jgi:acyl carrier protein